MSKIKTLLIRFDIALKRTEISCFRGAVIAVLPYVDTLFHNHEGDSYRYAYPLIQYKRIGGKAALVCVGEGVETVGVFFAEGENVLRIGVRQVMANIVSTHALMTETRCWNNMFSYRLRDWLPLNEENYIRYRKEESLVERAKILEQTLTGNMLSLLKGVGIHMEEQIKVTIIGILGVRTVHYKRVPLMCFDVEFKANISLPEYIGLGKHASVGFGILTRIRKENKL